MYINFPLDLYGGRALWRVGKLKRSKRTPRVSVRWKPVVKSDTQEGTVSYDSGVIWLPVRKGNSDNRNTPTSDTEQSQSTDSSNQTECEPKTDENTTQPKTKENVTSPPDVKIKVEEMPQTRSLSVSSGTKHKNKPKAGKFIITSSSQLLL